MLSLGIFCLSCDDLRMFGEVTFRRYISLYFIFPGDIEVLMDMDTSLQTAKCTQKTEVLVLEMKHYERLLVKRNPKTIKTMKKCLDLRLKSRMIKHEDQLPLFELLYNEVLEFTATSEGQSHARHAAKGGGDHKTQGDKSSNQRKTVEEYFQSFIPPPGALIDMYGPGTVFHRIREREKTKLLKKKGGKQQFATPGYTSPRTAQNGSTTSHHPARENGRLGSPQQVDPLTTDDTLLDLEDRMRLWLQWDGAKAQPRVSKMHRSNVEVIQCLLSFFIMFILHCDSACKDYCKNSTEFLAGIYFCVIKISEFFKNICPSVGWTF